MKSPAGCLFIANQEFNFFNCKKYYFKQSPRHLIPSGNFIQLEPNKDLTEIERYSNISDMVLSPLQGLENDEISVYLEGYSYGSGGNVFDIAENTAILKYKLLTHFGIKANTVPPKTIKKFCINGNATKWMMEEQFIKETNYDVRKELKQTQSQENPSSDIIDSYYLCKYGTKEQGII